MGRRRHEDEPDPLFLPEGYDDRSVREWAGFGLSEMTAYLATQARFADWLRAHPEHDDPALD